MKTLCIALMFCPLLVLGDDIAMAYFTMEVTLKDHSKIERYLSIPEYAFSIDSIEQDAYAKPIIIGWMSFNDSITFYKEWVTFTLQSPYAPDEELTVISIGQEEKIALEKIVSIHVKEVKYQSGSVGIANSLTKDDQEWMSGSPIRIVRSASYLCDFYIYQFEENSKLNSDILDFIALGSKSKEYDDDSTVFDFIRVFDQSKIVIVAWCTE